MDIGIEEIIPRVVRIDYHFHVQDDSIIVETGAITLRLLLRPLFLANLKSTTQRDTFNLPTTGQEKYH